MWKVDFEKKSGLPVPTKKFPSLILSKNAILLDHLIFQCSLYYSTSVWLYSSMVLSVDTVLLTNQYTVLATY